MQFKCMLTIIFFFRFPDQPPSTKEEYMYREMFSHHFPSPSAKKTVPSQGKSIACSTAAAIAWDASFENLLDPSGRAVGGVHDQVYTALSYYKSKIVLVGSKNFELYLNPSIRDGVHRSGSPLYLHLKRI